MSAPRFGRWQKASALVPLAMLSAAWTASLAGVGVTSASAGEDPASTLPDGSTVPSEAIEAPASVSQPGALAPGLDGRSAQNVVATASTSGIPSAALAAYQRAETVINSADRTCNLSWQLVAAIGRVESDHGRYGGNTLTEEGLAVPGIFGIALDGSKGTAVISDSDAGLLDGDTEYDRAVGPMQFIPSTWRVVGVDADGDAERNPQDIDDAALASAVYLCSGKDDLSTVDGQRASVFRYNHSESYVDLVLSIMNAYLAGDFTSVPNGTTSAGYFVPSGSGGGGGDGRGGSGGGGNGGGDASGSGDGDGGTSEDPTDDPTTDPTLPTGGDGGGDGDGDGGGGGLPTQLPDPTELPDPEDTLTEAEALAQCLADGVIDNPLTAVNELTQCVNDLLNP